jgi:hypothetical protein
MNDEIDRLKAEVAQGMLKSTRRVLSKSVEYMRKGYCSPKDVRRASIILDGLETSLHNTGYDTNNFPKEARNE